MNEFLMNIIKWKNSELLKKNLMNYMIYNQNYH